MRNKARSIMVSCGLLICGMAGCLSTQVSEHGPKGKAPITQNDFNAAENDFNAMGFTFPAPYQIDGKVGDMTYTAKKIGEVRTMMSRKGVLTATKINGAEIDILNKKGSDTSAGLTLVVHAAGKIDLSKPENVTIFEQALQPLFAAHRETVDLYVRVDGRILSLHGEAGRQTEAKAASILACEPGKDMTLDLGSGVNMELVWIDPGEFMMGSPENEEGRSYDESPQHKATVSKGFWLGKYEVTQEQWEPLMGRNPSEFRGGNKPLPVEQVSWEDAQKFMKRLNEVLGSPTNSLVFKLPTETQWEYACRAGTTTPYAGSLDAMGWYADNGGRTTHPVGQKQANAWGLYDMHGNVWEWCVANEREYSGNPPTEDEAMSGRTWKFIRGGGIGFNAAACRSANRIDAILGADPRVYSIGFRVAALP